MMDLLKNFKLDAPVASCERYGCGHVNETYLVVSESGRRYTLQKISTRAFHDVPALMQNIISVTQFLKEKTEDNKCSVHGFSVNKVSIFERRIVFKIRKKLS